ncbi:MAG: hypothetical protein LBU03_01495 [Tannerellaceae bacterium]|jgi:hypothetical protein|nr:hypothetical protein [Tannerellaceae bacterium]
MGKLTKEEKEILLEVFEYLLNVLRFYRNHEDIIPSGVYLRKLNELLDEILRVGTWIKNDEEK